MKIVGLMPVRNEDWILGLSARVALQWCDELVVGLHACTDLSESIADGINAGSGEKRLQMLDLAGNSWDEMLHRQALLNEARELNATHIAMIDADEILAANLLPRIRSLVEGAPRGHLLQLPLYNLRGGIGTYHSNGLWGNRIVSVAFADDPALGWRGDRFHAREPEGRRLTGYCPLAQGDGGVLHFWGASERRIIAKHALYKVTERLRWPDKPVLEIDRLYSAFRDGLKMPGEIPPHKWTRYDTPWEWTGPYFELIQKHLHIDAVPWQEAEVKRLIAEHGRERFAGLDLFGVDA